MLSALENYYAQQKEPQQGCLLALRSIILGADTRITPEWKYKLPFFYLDGKMFCYLHIDKQSGHPYVGVVNGNKIDHPALESGERVRIKILPVDPFIDLPVDELQEILKLAIDVHYPK